MTAMESPTPPHQSPWCRGATSLCACSRSLHLSGLQVSPPTNRKVEQGPLKGPVLPGFKCQWAQGLPVLPPGLWLVRAVCCASRLRSRSSSEQQWESRRSLAVRARSKHLASPPSS